MSNAKPRAPVPGTPLPTLAMHWALVLALAASLATGLRIAADAPDARVTRALAGLLPQGDVLLWHLAAGAAVIVLVLAYALYQWVSGLGRRWLPGAFGSASPQRRLDLTLFWGACGLLGLAIATGLLQYLALSPAPRAWIETVHRVAAWGLALYVPVHVALQIAAGGLRRLVSMLVPRRAFFVPGALALAVSGLLVLGLAAIDRMVLGTLGLARTQADSAPLLDGDPGDPAWQSARPVRLALGNGANLPGGETRVSLRGLYDGERVYLLVEWSDPTRSQKHVPLVKTEGGWKILQTAYRRADETRYYEDKLALMLAPSDPLAALTSVHLGARPLAGQPGAPGGRGLHYTTDGSILDVWHWKSVRTGAERQADDNFFGPPLPAPAETPREPSPDSGAWLPRYQAGYRSDPPGTFPGYEMNWEYFDEQRSLPLRLPKDPEMLADLGAADLSPERSDAGRWWIELNDTRPYAQGPDDLPVGTVLPSVLAAGRLTGDRGDIRASGRWSDGRWVLELSRRLSTGSEKDVPVADGTLLWVAVFDHSQTRHAYHLRPIRISLL